mgnify:CR=1 FL=1
MGIATRSQVLTPSNKHLFFRASSTAYSCFPVNSLLGFSEKGTSATTLVLYFDCQTRMDSGYYDYIELTVTDITTAIEDIMEAINYSPETVITVADTLNSSFLTASISGTDGINTATNSGVK